MHIKYLVEGPSEISTDKLYKVAGEISKKLNLEGQFLLGLKFVDKEEIRIINKKYAENDYATDVLSFVYDNNTSLGNKGDIVICSGIAKRQAKEHSISLENELILLLVHATLHIFGYDHQSKSQVSSLDGLQSDIMSSLGYDYRDFKWHH